MKKIISALALALVLGFTGVTTTQAQIVGIPLTPATFTRDLTLSARGNDVTALQNFLISKGYNIGGAATGYFGLQTKAALAAYQVSKGISPADGYFGPITRASVNAEIKSRTKVIQPGYPLGCTSGTGYSSVTGLPCSIIATSSAQLTLSASPSPIPSGTIIISPYDTVNAQFVNFNVKSEGGDAKITDVSVFINASGTIPTTLYLYSGTSLISSRTVPGGYSSINATVTFSNLNYIVANNTMQTITIKGDFPANGNAGSVASVNVNSVTYQRANGTSVTTTNGAVIGSPQYFFKAAPQINLSTAPTATASNNTNGQTISITGIFPMTIQALGGTMIQPVPSDFTVKYGISTPPQYTASIVSVTTIPNGNIAEGSTANVTLTAVVPASSIPMSGLYTFSIESIKYKVGTVSGIQNYGLENFKTPNAVMAVVGSTTPSEETNITTCPSSLPILTTNLTVGDQNDSVHNLKCFLNSKGYLLGNYLNSYYGNYTKAALAAYQTSKGISPNDGVYFGPITRAAVNADIASNPTASVTVLSPNTGGSFTAGGKLNVAWKSSNLPVNSRIVIQAIGTYNESLAGDLIDDGNETVTIPEYLMTGSYTIRVSCVILNSEATCGSGTSDSSDAPITINALPSYITLSKVEYGNPSIYTGNGTEVVYSKNFSGCLNLMNESGTINLTPTLSGLYCSNVGVKDASASAQFSLPVGQRVKLCSATNPSLCSNVVAAANYAVIPPLVCTGLTMDLGSITTIPYSYQNDTCDGFRNVQGTKVSSSCYSKIECSAIPGANCVNIANAKFQCTATTSPYTVTVLSPNGGEKWQIGSTYNITWKTTNFPNGSTVYIELRPNNFNIGSVSKIAAINAAEGYYSWKIPSTIVPADYIIEMYKADANGNIDQNTTAKDVSDQPFTISSSNVNPTITITSPNGGETWTKGTTQTIKWRDTSAGFVATYYDIRLVPLSPTCPPGAYCAIPAPYLVAGGVTGSSYDWRVGLTKGDVTAPDGAYNLQICQTGTNTCDTTDSYFKISGQTISVNLNNPANSYTLKANGTISVQFWWYSTTPNGYPYAYLLKSDQDNSNPAGGAYSSIDLISYKNQTSGTGGEFNNVFRTIVPGQYKVVVCDQTTDIRVPTCGASNIFTVGPNQTAAGDLVVDSFSWTPVTPTVGQTDPYLYFTASVKNIGTGIVFVPSNTEFSVTNNGTTVGRLTIGTGSFSLSPNETKALTFSSVQSPSILSQEGQTSLVMTADSNNLVSESNENNNSLTKQITINSPTPTLSISTDSLISGTVGGKYSALVEGAGGATTYEWSIIKGSLPAGIAITSSRCRMLPCQLPFELNGTATVGGTYPITIQLKSGSSVTTKDFSIVVSQPIGQSEETDLQSCAVPVYTFSTNLALGDSNYDVLRLKCFLNSKGYLAANYLNTYFGDRTKTALMQYQVAKGIAPADGSFGPITRASVNAAMNVTPGQSSYKTDVQNNNSAAVTNAINWLINWMNGVKQ